MVVLAKAGLPSNRVEEVEAWLAYVYKAIHEVQRRVS